MKPTRKQQLHNNIREEIKSAAWKQIAASGASALSLGGIAREMGLTTPALYRYFPGRDSLVSALIAEAYSSFNEALVTAREAVAPDDHAGRFRSLCLAYHAWARTHPQHYVLIFGSPLPINKLDAAVSRVADRSFLTLLEMIAAADQAGRIKFPSPTISVPASLTAQLESLQDHGQGYSARVTYLALVSWSFIHGMVSLELYGGYSLILADQVDTFIQLEVERFLETIGLE